MGQVDQQTWKRKLFHPYTFGSKWQATELLAQFCIATPINSESVLQQPCLYSRNTLKLPMDRMTEIRRDWSCLQGPIQDTLRFVTILPARPALNFALLACKA